MTLFAAAVLAVSCDTKEEPAPSLPVLNVGQTELTFEQGGGTATLTVTSNRPWTITSDADWLAFNPSSGSAADAPVNVTVTALANSSTDRTSSFRVKTDFDYKTVSSTTRPSVSPRRVQRVRILTRQPQDLVLRMILTMFSLQSRRQSPW